MEWLRLDRKKRQRVNNKLKLRTKQSNTPNWLINRKRRVLSVGCVWVEGRYLGLVNRCLHTEIMKSEQNSRNRNNSLRECIEIILLMLKTKPRWRVRSANAESAKTSGAP